MRSRPAVSVPPAELPAGWSRLREWSDANLFGRPAPGELGRGGAAALTLGVALGVMLLLLRQGLGPPLDSLWAEDGAVFLQTALDTSLAEAVAQPYSGYLHLVPRTVAEVIARFPAAWWPALTSLLAATLVSVSAATVYVASGAQLHGRPLRVTLAALVVLLPSAGHESLNTLAYTHWYLLAAVFWVLLWRPATWWGTAWAGALVLVTGLSTPVLLLLAPLALLRGAISRFPSDRVVAGAFAVGAVVQGTVVATGSPPAAGGAGTDLGVAYLLRVVGGSALGQAGTVRLWIDLGWVGVLLLAVGLVVLVAFLANHRDPRTRAVSLLLVGSSAVIFLVTASMRGAGEELVWAAGTFNDAGARYTIVPVLLLLSAAAVYLDRRGLDVSPRRWARLRAAAIGVVALVAAVSFTALGNRDRVSWSEQLHVAAERCTAGTDRVVVPVSPAEGWTIALPCRRAG